MNHEIDELQKPGNGLPNARTQKALVLIRFCKTCQPFNKY